MTASGSKLRSNEVSISFTPVLYNSCSTFSIESQYWLVLLLLLPITLATTLYINSTPYLYVPFSTVRMRAGTQPTLVLTANLIVTLLYESTAEFLRLE